MTTVLVRTPTFTRYRRHFWGSNGKSILRCLEYERLSTLGLTGRVLDFGGGSMTNYSDQIVSWGDPDQGYIYESANIDSKTKPTYTLDPGETIPVESDRYDVVLSLNTFEHVYDLQSVFTEIHRVLMPAGRLVFVVPFIFRVHGHPDDYMRGTASFWEKFLNSRGFEMVEIEAMSWGPFSAGLTVSGSPGPFKTLRRNLALLMDVIYFARHYSLGATLRVDQDAPNHNTPIGYFIQSTKH